MAEIQRHIDEFTFPLIGAQPRSNRCQVKCESIISSHPVNRAETGRSKGCTTRKVAATSSVGKVQNIATSKDNPTQRKYGGQKVNHKHLSKLMRAILSPIDIDKGVERGELIERIFELPRRYCNFYTDPCMSPKERRKYERCYRRAQPSITRALKRLEERGLVRLTRHKRYVKRLNLTPQGKLFVDMLTSA